LERMLADGYNVGGEQSGHMILSDHSTTGDGLVAALQVLAALIRSGRQASEVLRLFTPLPQLLRNIRVEGRSAAEILAAPTVKGAIAAGEARLAGQGRLLIRKSGTEPLIRVMAEGEDEKVIEMVAASIIDAIRTAAA